MRSGVQKSEGGDRFHQFPIYNERGGDQSVPPEVHYKFFCLKDIQLPAIFGATARHVFHLCPVHCLTSIRDEPYHGVVISILDNDVS